MNLKLSFPHFLSGNELNGGRDVLIYLIMSSKLIRLCPHLISAICLWPHLIHQGNDGQAYKMLVSGDIIIASRILFL